MYKTLYTAAMYEYVLHGGQMGKFESDFVLVRLRERERERETDQPVPRSRVLLRS